MTWPKVQLGEVCDFLDRRRRPVKEADRAAGPYPYFGANGQQGTIDGFLFDEPLVLLAEDGGHFDDPQRGIAYGVEGKCWVNNHAHVLRPKPRIDVRYLARVLENRDVTPYVTGTTRAKLTKSGAERVEIPLPPLPEQRRIAASLDHADSLRTKRRAAIEAYDELRRSTFARMFDDPSRNAFGFPLVTIGDLVDSTQYGTSEKSGDAGEFRVLGMGNLTVDGRIDPTGSKLTDLAADKFERYTVRRGDLLFNRTNSPDLVGKTAVYGSDVPMAYAGYLIRVRFNDEVDSHYVAGYLNSGHGKTVLRNMCKSIIGMANINAKEMQKIRILRPPFELQHKYARAVEAIESSRWAMLNELTQLDALFSSLQSRAFRGEL